MSDWRTALLAQLGAPATPESLRFLNDWQRQEGGATNNSATYNWLNTTRGDQYPTINSVGVRAFPDFNTGIRQIADTLGNGRYTNLLAGLKAGNPYTSGTANDLSTWVSGDPRSSSGAAYSARVLNGHSTVKAQAAVPKAAPAAENPGVQPRAAITEAQDTTAIDTGRQAKLNLLGMALSYATEGQVDSNVFANMVGATSSKGTVEPPTVKTKQGPAIPTPAKGTALSPKAKEINRVLAAAHDQVGKPYVFGSGPDTSSFDCSDLIQYAYKQIGVELPRTTWDQIHVGKPVKWGQFQPGDLIFSSKGGHVTMYVGGGKVIAAPYTGTVVQYQPVSRFRKSFVTARRVV